MTNRSVKICLWSGLAGLMINGTGLFGIMQFFPPLSPSTDAQQMAAIYRANPVGIALGSTSFIIASMLFLCFGVAVAEAMKRIRGGIDVLTMLQLLACAIGSAIFILPTFLFSAAAFRPERSPELVLLLSDLGWFSFIVPALPGAVQIVAFGCAVLSDRNPTNPLLPRWLGYLSFWVALTLIPDLFVVVFKTGPFAWNGLIGFWLAGIAINVWVIAVMVQMFKAVRSPRWNAPY